nr:triacylglycerol lipase (EC 3.1.1.3) II - Rhizopus niveus (strain IFO 4759) (fragments) [Rhizopus niveus]
SDGGKVVAATL